MPIQNVFRTNNILDVYKQCKEIIEKKENVFLFLDIDDTVLSTRNGQKFVDKNIVHLVQLIYAYNPNRLWFLTAREPIYRQPTINQLNLAKLVDDGKYIPYNVIFSPFKIENGDMIATKGETLSKFLTTTAELPIGRPNWIIFVDDNMDQINSVNAWLKQLNININYTLYKYM